MSRTSAGTQAIVIALTDPSTPALGESLARFAEEAGPLGQVILVDASGRTEAADLARSLGNVRVIQQPVGRLAPLLWRDGLLATDAEVVAFTTAQMIPGPGWLVALRKRLRDTGAAGVGGPIEPGLRLSKIDRAVALLRYSSYFPPLTDSPRIDPPGDNSLYRRDRLMEVESAWRDGFWEVDVHRALRDRGHSFAMAGSAVVTFVGGIGLCPMVRQRVRHARRYGACRSNGLGTMARLARVVASPLVIPLLCSRIVRSLRVRGRALTPWLGCSPSLLSLASAWAMGEAVGLSFGVRRMPEPSGPVAPSPQPSPARGEGVHHWRDRDTDSFFLLAPSPLAGEGWGEGATGIARRSGPALTINDVNP